MGQKGTQSYFMDRETQPSWGLGLNILQGAMGVVEAPGEAA